MNQREQRKKALEAAKQRLAFRRKQKEQLQLLRQQKQSGVSTGFENQETRKNDYGKKLIDDTKEIIKDWTTKKETEEQKLIDDEKHNQQSTENKKQIVPGPRADLNIVHSVNVVDLMKRSRVEYVKEIQTDSVEIGQHSNIITDQTNNEQLNEILATFIENDINPWPNKKDEIYKRITIQKQPQQNDNDEDDDMKQQQADTGNIGVDGNGDGNDNDEHKKEKEEEVLVLSNDEATKLFKSSQFLSAFKKKAKFLDAALGINEEHSVFIEAHSTIRDIKENSSMEKLIKIGELSSSFTNGRPITSLDFDKNMVDRFLASYSGAMFKPMSISESKSNDDDNSQKTSSEQQSSDQPQQQPLNIQSDGLINIFDIDQETNKYKIISTLECQSMINCAQFHPTKENIIIGASVSGQVLGWDISLNKKTPTIRTDFSSSSHTQPIFALKFLPSMLSYMPSSKIQQIITLSNDGKLCVWRDDMLYKPNYEFLLKLSKGGGSNSNNGGGTATTTTTTTTNQAKEITTTCFSHPKLFNENDNKLWFGSDEGCIYETNLNLNKNDERELAITSFISSAHYGPITCIDFYKCQSINSTEYNLQNGLYLTSSFDWTVKLWHISSSKSIALFNQMEDYVYDVQWSPINPSIFAVVDGSGNLTIFNLNISFEHPASEPTNILLIDKEEHQIRPNMEQISITKLLWSPNGKQIIVGDSNGNISIFDLPVSDPVAADFDKFEEIIKRKLDSVNI